MKLEVRITNLHGEREFKFPGDEVEFFEHIQFLIREMGKSRKTEFGANVGPAIEIRKFPESEAEEKAQVHVLEYGVFVTPAMQESETSDEGIGCPPGCTSPVCDCPGNE